MADCIKPYYCNPLEAYPTSGSCDTQDEYVSGWSSFGLVECGTEIVDPGSATELNALVAAGKLSIINGVKGSLDEPGARTIDSTTSCGVTKTVGYDRTFTALDYKTSPEVVEWYNRNKRKQYGGALLFGCDGFTSYVNRPLNMTAVLSGENNNAAVKVMTAVLAWQELEDPVPVETAAGY